ncbi:MAG: DUF7521 family protein [Halodesulfurarchaeum sp.]
MRELTGLIFALKTITVALGGLITFYAYKASQRTRARALWYLAIGFAVITLGALLGGVIDQLLRLTREWAIVMESFLAIAGFAIILYSLYVD